MVNHTIIGLTPGSERGVGPELMIKALMDDRLSAGRYFWCGDRLSLELAARRAGRSLEILGPGQARLERGPSLSFVPGSPARDDCGARQAWFLEQGAKLGLSGHIDALVTGPINKSALGYLDQGPITGQTEYFAKLWARPGHRAFMAFMGGPFIMSLMTTHVPLREVASHLTVNSVEEHLSTLAQACAPLLNKRAQDVSIHVLGLNPHAGEQGLLGWEEQEVIEPAIQKAQAQGLKILGPLPADGYFAYFHEQSLSSRPDAVVAMYHDQGLIPYKLLSRGGGVNVTMGLTIPRTSPAHGTAEDLAGKNLASPLSTINAIVSAGRLIKSPVGLFLSDENPML